MTEVEITENNIKVKTGDVETNIEPPATGKLITRALVELKEKGFPSNEELNEFGDQLFALLEAEVKNIGDVKTKKIVESIQNVVEDVKSTVKEINVDESLQKIAKTLKEEALPDIDLNDEAQAISNSLREIFPMILSLGRTIMTDYALREFLLSIINIGESKVDEIKENVNDTDIVDVLKQDIRDTSQTTPERTKETVKEKVEDIKNMDVKITEDEMEEIKENAINALISIREKPQYKTFFENLFMVHDQIMSIWNKIYTNPDLQNAYDKSSYIFHDIKTLIEKSSGRSLKDFEYYLHEVAKTYDDLKDTQYKELRQDFEDLIVDNENKYTTEEDIRNKIEDIKGKLNEIKDQYGGAVKDLMREISEIFNGIANDSSVSKLVEDVNKMILVIFSDQSGNPSPMVAIDSIARIKDVFLPIFTEKLKYLTLPTINIETDRYYYSLTNLSLRTTDIMPEMIQIDTESNITLDLKESRRKGHFTLKFNVSPINIDIDNLGFTVMKKTGSHYNDYGVVDLKIRDASFVLEFLFNVEYDSVARVELTKSETHLGSVNLHIIEAKHDLWDKFLTTLFMPGIKKRITSKIDETLYDNINNEVCQRINDGLLVAERKRQDKKKFKKLKEKLKPHISIHSEEKTPDRDKFKVEVTVKKTQNTQE